MQVNRNFNIKKTLIVFTYLGLSILIYNIANNKLYSKINKKYLKNNPKDFIDLIAKSENKYKEVSKIINELGLNKEFKSDNIKKNFTVPQNLNFRQFLIDFGINEKDCNNISYSMGSVFSKLQQNQSFDMNYDYRQYYKTITDDKLFPQYKKMTKEYNVHKITMQLPKIEKNITILKDSSGIFTTTTENIQVFKKIKRVKGVIKNSLYGDTIGNGVSTVVIHKMLEEYSYDIDFQRDIHAGDKFEVIFEEYFDANDNKIRDGKLLYSGLYVQKKWYKLYRHNDSFYDENGVSVKKSLLKTPVDGARISSGFSSARKHPVLGFTRAHKGVDFAAPIGTAIYAAGEGVVTYVGWGGGYGNLVSIKHNGTYSTNYAHMSRFAKNMKKGTKVKQRQVIGYIGVTGLTSGPHLHFELVKNGEKINPQKHVIQSTDRISKADMTNFKHFVANMRFDA